MANSSSSSADKLGVWQILVFQLFPTPVWLYPAMLGSLTGLTCTICDRWTLGYEWSVAVAVLLTCAWTLVNREIRRRSGSIPLLVQLVVSVVLISLSTVAVFGRTGGNTSSARGLTYWITMNQTYRYNPQWTARPAWFALAGLSWFACILGLLAFRRTRVARLLPCAARLDPQ